jgi:hypothetical protein
MEAKFTVNAKEIKHALLCISRLRPRFFKKNEFLRIRVLSESIEISTQGIMKVIKAETDAMVDISVPAMLVKAYVDTASIAVMSFVFKPGELHIGSSIYSSPSISLENLYNFPENEIPLNATNMYLLCFARRKGTEQINKLGLEPLINKAKRELSINIKKAITSLEQYGITYQEVNELIERKICEKNS